MAAAPKHIVYILADDLGYGDLGCYNAESRIPTPNLDRLASEGVRFTDGHAPSAVCTPTRYGLLTGRYPWRGRLTRGVLWPWDPPLIEPERPTVASWLRDRGYRTACIGKWHLGWEWPTQDGRPPNEDLTLGVNDRAARQAVGQRIDFRAPVRGGPIERGFDHYFGDDVPNFPPYTWIEDDRVLHEPTEQKPAEMLGNPGPMAPGWRLDAVMPELTRRAVAEIEGTGEKPLFLYMPLTAPHEPIVPTPAFEGMSGAGAYGDFVCEVDWTVGEVMKALDRAGMRDDTLLVFTSDNGPEHFAYERIQEHGHWSMDGLRGLKRDAWEGGHRVPLIARWPAEVEAGAECEAPVCLTDLFATLADAMGEPLPEDGAEDSFSMLAPLTNGRRGAAPRDELIHHAGPGDLAIRRGSWVLIDSPTGDKNKERDWFRDLRGYESHEQPRELFDLSSDAIQRVNRYADRPDVADDLLARLARAREGRGLRVDGSG